MRWEKYKVPLLQLGLIVTGVVAVISLISVFILDARLKKMQSDQTAARETSAVLERSDLEQQLMVYGSADEKALVIRDSFPMQALSGDSIIFNASEDVFAANDADGRFYVWRMSDGELLTTYANTSYERALLIGQNRILLEDNGYLYCFDYTSGMQLWKWQFPYEDCLWEYESGTETIYIMAKNPDVETQTVETQVSDENDWDDEDWDDDSYEERRTTTETVITSVKHDIYVLSIDGLSVNYIRPQDLLSEEMNYDTTCISDISLSEDASKLLVNGYLSDADNEYDRYFSRIYQVSDISFVPDAETPDSENGEGGETAEGSAPVQTSEIVKEVSASYNESGDNGFRMMTRWIDNESVLQYSETIPSASAQDAGEDWEEEREETDGEDTAPGSAEVAAETDELDEDPDTVEWYVRKRTLPYASTVWRINGNGEPTDDPRLYSYTEGDYSYLILTLRQCAVTLGQSTGQEEAVMIDTDDFIYIEPKNKRPTMYVTTEGSVIQGKRHYGLGVSLITAMAKSGDTYYVAAENSIFRYTMAGNVADSGTRLIDSDEISWNRAVLSGDGKYAAISGQRYLRLYRTEDGKRIYQNVCTLSHGADAVFAGDMLCHIDASGKNLVLYDPANDTREKIELTGTGAIQNSEIRSYGMKDLLVAREDGQLMWIIDTEAKAITRMISAKDICGMAELDPERSTVEYCRMSPDAKYLIYSVRVSDDAGALTLKAYVTDLETSLTTESDDLASKLDVPEEELPALNTMEGVFSSDSHRVIYAGKNNAIGVLDLEKAAFAHETNCGELSGAPVFTRENYIACVTKGGDLCVIDSETGSFVACDEEGNAFSSDELFSMDRPGSVVTLFKDSRDDRMYAYGVKNGKTFVRVYAVFAEGVLTPETEIPSAVTSDAGQVLMRYGSSEAELFPYLTLDELQSRAASEE